MAEDANLEAQVKTYDGLINTLKWGAVAVAVIAATVIWLIAR